MQKITPCLWLDNQAEELDVNIFSQAYERES